MIKIKKERTDLSLDKLSELLKNPPQNVYVSIYTKERIEVEPVGRPSEKMTLSKLAMTVSDLAKQMNEGFKRLDSKMDAGFKQVNDRIDKVEHRLDLVEQRLDYNGLQIVEINKRLDYNGLKPLPNK